jgi:alpha-beta hydrolase superfamily lysophospholipase
MVNFFKLLLFIQKYTCYPKWVRLKHRINRNSLLATFGFVLGILCAGTPSAHARPDDCNETMGLLFEQNGEGWHTTREGHEIYTHFTPPKKGKKSVYVMVNGLVYSTDRWDKLVKELVKDGHGVLRYDFLNQAKTLGKQTKAVPRSLDQQVGDLKELFNKHQKGDREMHIVGLSYGASIATEYAKKHPEDLKSLNLMSPLVVSTDRYDSMGMMTRNSLEMYRMWGMYESMYETTYRRIIRQAFTETRYPDVPIDRYQDALYELGKAVRDFDLKQEIQSVKNLPVKLILAGEEGTYARADILKVAEILKKRGGEGFTEIKGAAHAIPDVAPVEGAKVLLDQAYFGKK